MGILITVVRLLEIILLIFCMNSYQGGAGLTARETYKNAGVTVYEKCPQTVSGIRTE